MPGKVATLVKTVEIDRASRRHECSRNAKHLILKGDVRLTVGGKRNQRRYCAACAIAIVEATERKIQAIRERLNTEARA